MSRFRLLVRNSGANVAAGASNALLAVALPPILVRYLSAAEFSAWSVVLQLAAVVYVLQFGVQVAVGRYVAYYTARGDAESRQQIVSTAFAAMWVSMAAALVIVALMSALLPYWFRGMPENLHGDARAALLLIGAGLALTLPASVVAGVYSGLQRNDVPAMFVVVSRFTVAVALFALASRGFGLLPMALAYAAIIGAASLAQLGMLGRRHADISFSRAAVTRAAGHELAAYCLSLTIWSATVLVSSGLDAVIAGYLDFRWAAYFGIAASAVALIVGLQSAMLQPLIAIAAHFHSRGEKRELGALLVEATRISTLVFLAAIAPLFVAGDWLARIWVGDVMGPQVLPIVRVLLLGVFVRQTLAPFATILLGTGEQRLIILPPVYEAIAKLATSIGLGMWLGPIGIALGTLVGAAVCVATNLLFTFPRVKGIKIETMPFIWRTTVQPLALFAPVLMLPLLLDSSTTTASSLAMRSALVSVTTLGGILVGLVSLRRLRALV